MYLQLLKLLSVLTFPTNFLWFVLSHYNAVWSVNVRYFFDIAIIVTDDQMFGSFGDFLEETLENILKTTHISRSI